VTSASKNIRRNSTLGAEGTERSEAHNAHNHPSGVAELSQADLDITNQLKKALYLVEIKVLDHIIVGGGDTVSFAERGLI
jgi:DNA repair protein RadC